VTALLALNARTFASLRKHRNYRLFFSGQIVSLSGTWMQNVALAWFVVELTRSPLAVGVLAFCRFAPFTVFGLFSGVVADRLDNRRLMIATQVSSMLVSIALAALAFSGAAQLWMVYALAAAGGTALVFDAPARHALTFQMVGREELPNAVALNASIFNASRIVGPAIGGVVIGAVGVAWCFAVNAASFLAVLAALLLMRVRELYELDRKERPTIFRGIGEGLVYVRRSRVVWLILVMTTVLSTVGFNFHVLVPVLAADTLRAGPEVFGILSASFGVGALTGALAAAGLGRASWKALLVGSVGFGVTVLALAPMRSVLPAALLLLGAGVAFTLWSSNAQSILQLTAPDHLRGRVLSIYLFAFAGLAPVGGLFAGWVAEHAGTSAAFAVAGAAGLAMAALGWLRSPYPIWRRAAPPAEAALPGDPQAATHRPA
jgi:MFS family permease